MRIAIIGIKGIPVIYSGFETFAEELSTRLVKDPKYKVTVYCRSPYIDKEIKKYKGVELNVLPTIKTKNLETIFHSFFSTIHACIFGNYDVIYYLGVGNAFFTIIPRLFGIKTLLNVDGFDWKREKWGSIAKSYLKLSSYLATIFPNIVITDSLIIKNYYSKKNNSKYVYIPYGFMDNLKDKNALETLKKYGLEKNKYFVWVGRIVPENHIEELLEAFLRLNTKLKCVIIGGNFYEDSYTKKIFNYTKVNKNIIFTGFLNREDYAVLVKNAFCYVETKRSGGTHPSLLEAMGFGCLIVSHNNKSNQLILRKFAIYYKNINELLTKLDYITDRDFKKHNIDYRKGVMEDALKYFKWEEIINEYKKVFNDLLNTSYYEIRQE